MTPLYPYRPAGEHSLPCTPPALTPIREGLIFIQLLRLLGEAFSADPIILQTPSGQTLHLLYQGTAFTVDGFSETYGEGLALLSRRWPAALFATTGARETARLTFSAENGRVRTRMYSVSGQPFDDLMNLCLRIETNSCEAAAHLAAAAGALKYRMHSAALDRSHEDFLRAETLLLPTEGSMFAYFSPERDMAGRSDHLFCLPAEKKQRLWRSFLSDGVQPLEFEWLWEAYLSGGPDDLLEWELTLSSVLEELRFSVDNRTSHFSVTDGGGNARQFDFVNGGPAEKMFLKLLFPAVRQR